MQFLCKPSHSVTLWREGGRGGREGERGGREGERGGREERGVEGRERGVERRREGWTGEERKSREGEEMERKRRSIFYPCSQSSPVGMPVCWKTLLMSSVKALPSSPKVPTVVS